MAIHVISNILPFDYVAKSDRDNEDKTIFRLQPLNGMQYMEVMAELQRDDQNNFKLSSRGLQMALKHGLIGWSNLNDENGKSVKFNSFNMQKVPPIILGELASEIIDRSEFGEAARKN